MLMREDKRFFLFAFDSAHAKYGVWPVPKRLFSFLMQVTFEDVKLKLSANRFLNKGLFCFETRFAETNYLQNSDHSGNRSQFSF